jgi:hypothetical protein
VGADEQWRRDTRRWALIAGGGVLALLALVIGLWVFEVTRTGFDDGPEYVPNPQVPPR